MEFEHDNVRLVVEEDRLSSLPDELIHKIMSSLDMKFVVQTCLLLSRWKHLWTSIPCLNFYSYNFGSLPKFAKFVTKVLSHRNHQTEVACVKLNFHGAASQVFVRKIAKSIFSHNVQQLSVSICPKKHHQFPPCLFSSQSLKHFTLSSRFFSPCITPKTPWDFPSLTTLHLNDITLCDDPTAKSVDLFSKCVNLKNLTLDYFSLSDVKVFDIITPRLSNLILTHGHRCSTAINLIAPQLENLRVIDCSFNYLNAPPRLSSLYYWGYLSQKLYKEKYQSLNEVSIFLDMYSSHRPYKEEDALKTINMLQELHSARYLTLNVDIVECLSAFPDLLSHQPSPFSNLSCLTIDSSKRKDAYKVKMSTEATNFFLENSPNAIFIMELPEPPPTKAMKQKEIATYMKELQALIHHEIMNVEGKVAKEKVNAALEKLMAEINLEAGIGKGHSETERLLTLFNICMEEMRPLIEEEQAGVRAIYSKERLIRSSMEDLPYTERTQVKAQYSQQLEEAYIAANEKLLAFEKLVSHLISIYEDAFGRKLLLPSQAPSSSSKTIPSIHPMP